MCPGTATVPTYHMGATLTWPTGVSVPSRSLDATWVQSKLLAEAVAYTTNYAEPPCRVNKLLIRINVSLMYTINCCKRHEYTTNHLKHP